VAQYREGLIEEVSGEGGVGFDSEALSRFAAEREAILTCLKRFAYIAAAGGYFGVYQIPNIVLGLIVVFLVIGEVADEILTERAGDEADAV
jgi:hypothetical protein